MNFGFVFEMDWWSIRGGIRTLEPIIIEDYIILPIAL